MLNALGTLLELQARVLKKNKLKELLAPSVGRRVQVMDMNGCPPIASIVQRGKWPNDLP